MITYLLILLLSLLPPSSPTPPKILFSGQYRQIISTSTPFGTFEVCSSLFNETHYQRHAVAVLLYDWRGGRYRIVKG